MQVMSDVLVHTTSNGNPWEVGEGNEWGRCSFLLFCVVVLGTEHGALYLIGEWSTTELQPSFFWTFYLEIVSHSAFQTSLKLQLELRQA